MSTPRIVSLGVPGVPGADVRTHHNAPVLTEYDIVVCDPTFNAVFGVPLSEGASYVGMVLSQYASPLRARRAELLRVLQRGGVVACFLRPPNVLTSRQGSVGEVDALEILLDPGQIKTMAIGPLEGIACEVLEDDGVMSPYLSEVRRWTAQMQRGALADDPFGFPLAVSREGAIVAYQESLANGTVFWLPQVSSSAHLVPALSKAWSERGFMGVIGAVDRERELEAELLSQERTYREKRATLTGELQRLRDARRRFLDEDQAVRRASANFRAAESHGPARALIAFHDMLEKIEQQFGGERQAQDALGYSASTASKITAPANNREYASRHSGSGEPVPVPTQVLAEAAASAREILDRFVAHRFAEWQSKSQ